MNCVLPRNWACALTRPPLHGFQVRSRRGSSGASSLLASVAVVTAANTRAREQARRRGGRQRVLAPCFRGGDLGRCPVAPGCDSCGGDVRRGRRGDVPVRMWSGLRRRWSSGTSTSAEMEGGMRGEGIDCRARARRLSGDGGRGLIAGSSFWPGGAFMRGRAMEAGRAKECHSFHSPSERFSFVIFSSRD
jgi:hypothetical protein